MCSLTLKKIIFIILFLLFCSYSYSDTDLKYIVYQSELNQLKLCLNNIEIEKNEALKTLQKQTENYKILQLELSNSTQILQQSDTKILNLENNLKNIQTLLEKQKNNQLKLEQELITNQNQLILAEQSFKEYKKEVTSKITKKEIEKYIFLLCGIGAGILIEKIK